MNFIAKKYPHAYTKKLYIVFILASLFFSLTSFAEKYDSNLSKVFNLAPKSSTEGSLNIEKWKAEIDSFINGTQSKNTFLNKFRTLDLWKVVSNLFNLEDRRELGKKDKRARAGKDRRSNLSFPLNNKDLNSLENEMVKYIQEELFKIYRDVSKNSEFRNLSVIEKISKANEKARIFINLCLEKRNELPNRLYNEIKTFEKFEFQTSITEAITHELKSMKQDNKSISMMGFGIAMSELNNIDYNLADFVRNNQLEFFNDLFKPQNQVLLAFNKVVVFGMDKKWNQKRDDLKGMSLLEYLNLYGVKGLRDRDVSENELKELFKNKTFLLEKYEKPLLERINSEIDIKVSSDSQRKRWKNSMSNRPLFKNKNSTMNFNVFTRTFSNLHARLLNIIENKSIINKLEAFDEALNDEIKADEEKIQNEIDPVFIGLFGSDKLNELTESFVDTIDEGIYLQHKDDEKFKGIDSFSEFKKHLNNLIKRKRYIKFDVYGNLTNFSNRFKMTIDDKGNINEAFLRDLLNEMTYLKALEIQARVFNEFEGRSKGLKYYYEDMDGMGDIPTEMFWYSDELGDGAFLPDRDRVELLKISEGDDKESAFKAFLAKSNQYRSQAMRNARHHKLIEKEFFDVIAEQSINFSNKKNEGNSFFDLGYLWDTNYPLMATIDGDELRVQFLGPDNKSYTTCFDFNNFQACDISLRKMNGAPYSRDNLLFEIHEGVIKSLIAGIDEFIESGRNKDEFAKDYEENIYIKSMKDVSEKVLVDLNPNLLPVTELNLQKEYFENTLNLLNKGQLFWNNGNKIDSNDDSFLRMQNELKFNLQKIEMFTNQTYDFEKLTSLSSHRQLDNNVESFFYVDSNGTIISPKLDLSLKFYFFDGLSKTEYSGRKEKGLKNNVEIGGIAAKGLSLPRNEEDFIPSYVFGEVRSTLDDDLSKVKKMIKFNSLIHNSDGSLTIDGELYTEDKIKKQSELIKQRKEFFTEKIKNQLILQGINENTKGVVADFLYRMQPFSWEIYLNEDMQNNWKKYFNENLRMSVYDKEFLTEEAVREHLSSLFMSTELTFIDNLIALGRHINQWFEDEITKKTNAHLIAA